MPRSSKTECTILGLLSLEPMSGYDMKAFISRSIGFFWQESYGQIYPALKRLHARKLVTRKVSGKDGRPERHVYSITRAGRRQLREWMKGETEPERLRNELLLKLFFGPAVSPKTHRQQIEALLEHQSVRLEQFRQAEKSMLEECEDNAFYPYWHSTLRFGVLVTRARVKWCRETLARLKKIEDEQNLHEHDRDSEVPE